MSSPGWQVRGKELWLADEAGDARIPSADEIYNSLIEREPAAGWIPVSVQGLRPSRYPLAPRLAIEPGEAETLPHYRLAGSVQGISVPLEKTDLERGHIVVDNVWYPIEPSAGTEVLELLNRTGIELGQARSLRAFLALRKAASAGAPVEDRLGADALSAMAFVPPADQTPIGVEATLYPYQLAGWRWLRFLLSEGIGGLLADEMGLGKTLQVISVLSDSGGTQLKPALIVAPGSLLENWRREIAKFAPHLTVLKHHGALRTGRPADLLGYDVVITSYDTVVRDNSLLNMVEWAAVILDEAQFIRNPQAQRTRSVKHLRRIVGLAVTGTPVENRLLDMWSVMDFVLPGHLGDQRTFEATFSNDVDGAAHLEPLVSPLMLRRLVADVAQDLPPRIDIPQVLELEEDEVAAYDALRQQIVDEYGANATLVALTTLRQFCAHPLLTGVGDSSDPMSFSKFRRLDEIVEEIFAQNEKVIIFTSYIAMADMIASHIEARFGTFTGVIDGRLPIDDRQHMIDQFSAVGGSAALVLNPKAGGTGLNITAANHVVHYNPEWNPAVEDQASARAHRRGQSLPVTVHRLLIADTVEDVMDDRLTRKRELSETAVIGIEGRDEEYQDIVAALSRSPSTKAGKRT